MLESLEPGLLLCLPWLCVTSHAGAGVQLCESDGGVQQQKSQRVSHQVCCARLKQKGSECTNKRCQSQHRAHGDGRSVSVGTLDQSWWHLLGVEEFLWRHSGGREAGWRGGCSTSDLWGRGRSELALLGVAAMGLLLLAMLRRITEWLGWKSLKVLPVPTPNS